MAAALNETLIIANNLGQPQARVFAAGNWPMPRTDLVSI